MTDFPEELKYHKAHDWVRVEGDIAEFGITWHAQDSLGDIVHYDPPQVGDTVVADDIYGEIESVKAVSELIAPCDGEVIDVNGEVAESPDMVNDDPYGAWLIKVRLADTSQLDDLLTSAEYEELLTESD